MAYVIVWSEDAVRDIDEIAEYIARDSIHYAKSVASKLYTAPEKVLDAPFSGREVPEFSDLNIREIFIYSYVLFTESLHKKSKLLRSYTGAESSLMPQKAGRSSSSQSHEND